MGEKVGSQGWRGTPGEEKAFIGFLLLGEGSSYSCPKILPLEKNGSNTEDTVEVQRGIGRNNECWGGTPFSSFCCLSKEYVPGEGARVWKQQSAQSQANKLVG